MSLAKHTARDLAKDFNMQSKELINVLNECTKGNVSPTKVLEDRLAVMDGTAATLCRDNKLPILVFDLADPDNIARAVQGENVGTLVYEG